MTSFLFNTMNPIKVELDWVCRRKIPLAQPHLLLVPTNMRKYLITPPSFPSLSFHSTNPSPLHQGHEPPPPQMNFLTTSPPHHLTRWPPHRPNLNTTSPLTSCVIPNLKSTSTRPSPTQLAPCILTSVSKHHRATVTPYLGSHIPTIIR